MAQHTHSKKFAAYPLLLEPHLSPKLWGGRRLAEFAHKSLPPNEKIGESWEAWDGCTIANGAHAGQTLGALIAQQPQAVLGSRAGAQAQFPLLFKYIDAQDHLSVQVHPDDAQAQRIEQEPFGKTEAWYILHADADAQLVHGFKRDANAESLQAQLDQQNVEALLSFVPVQRGDVIFVPAGTVHAIGKGIVLAEIQQSSDTTYRLYDWNRTDERGQSRELHVDKSLQVYDPSTLDTHRVAPLALEGDGFTQNMLVACRYFVLELLEVREKVSLPLADQFHIVSLLEGEALVNGERVRAGQTLVLPAALDRYTLAPQQTPLKMLRAYVPDLRADVIEPLRAAGHAAAQIAQLGGPVARHNDLLPLL